MAALDDILLLCCCFIITASASTSFPQTTTTITTHTQTQIHIIVVVFLIAMHNSYVKSNNRWQSKRSKNITSNLVNASENALIEAPPLPRLSPPSSFPTPTHFTRCSPTHLHISMHAIRRVWGSCCWGRGRKGGCC